MRIGIDVSYASGNRTGTGNYTLNLIQNLLAIDQENEYILYFGKKYIRENPLYECNGNNVAKRVIDVSLGQVRIQCCLPFHLARDRVEIYHSMGFFLPLLWRGEKIVTIHDLNFLHFKEFWWSLGLRWSYLSLVTGTKIATHLANKIITVSQNSKWDIIKRLKIPSDKVYVIYEGVNEFFRYKPKIYQVREVRDKYKLDKFFLFVGVLSHTKNIERLIKSFYLLTKKLNLTYKLVIVGRQSGTYYRDVLLPLVNKLNLQKKIIFTGFVSQKVLRIFYNIATALIFPSLIEGFGLPILEAMASGTPVITSNISAMPEVAGDAALLVDPYNATEIANAMERLLSDEQLRRMLVDKGLERVKLFSWQKVAKQTLKVYEKVKTEK